MSNHIMCYSKNTFLKQFFIYKKLKESYRWFSYTPSTPPLALPIMNISMAHLLELMSQ